MNKYLIPLLFLVFSCTQPEKRDCSTMFGAQIAVPIDDDSWGRQVYQVYQEVDLHTVDLPSRAQYFESNTSYDSIYFTSSSAIESLHIMALWMPDIDQKWFEVVELPYDSTAFVFSDSVSSLAVFALAEERVDELIEVTIGFSSAAENVNSATTILLDVIDTREMRLFEIPTLQDAEDFSLYFIDPCYDIPETSHGFLSEQKFVFGNTWGADYWWLENYQVFCFRSPNNFHDYLQ